MGIESKFHHAPPRVGFCLQKESPSMGIESSTYGGVFELNEDSCKKSPQAWGLKGHDTSKHHSTPPPCLQKESPSMGIERLYMHVCFLFLRRLAKRVPKHGD